MQKELGPISYVDRAFLDGRGSQITIDVINVYYVFYSSHGFTFLTFFFNFVPRFFFIFNKRCQMQSMNIQKSNEKYS